jgi:tRNA(Arg) A34 adenosine deaminase TadA
MKRAVELALAAERAGNVPVGALITLDGEVIARGSSEVMKPVYHPGRHAEMVALARVDETLWPRAREMTCYTTLEPCVMCAGALLLHGVGRVVFGALDVQGGAGCVLEHLPPYYDQGGVYAWEGPLMAEVCDALDAKADEAFAALPAGTVEDLLKPENIDQLTAILTYHVVPGNVMSTDLTNNMMAPTVQGGDLTIMTDGGVTVNGANVTTADIETSNGVIHVIDAVIIPE